MKKSALLVLVDFAAATTVAGLILWLIVWVYWGQPEMKWWDTVRDVWIFFVAASFLVSLIAGPIQSIRGEELWESPFWPLIAILHFAWLLPFIAPMVALSGLCWLVSSNLRERLNERLRPEKEVLGPSWPVAWNRYLAHRSPVQTRGRRG
jgi:hypothetical protein